MQLEKFKCGICGKEWGTPRERAQCELKCDEVEQVKAEHAHIEKLKAGAIQHTVELQFKWDEFWKGVDEHHVKFNKPVVLKMGHNNMLRVDVMRSLLALWG